MSADRHSTDLLDRLLRVKEKLGLSESTACEHEPADASESSSVTCIRCGYDQQGQVVNRCPECGLLWALNYRDPTLWASDHATVVSWLGTAKRIWSWENRCRVRTSLVPATPDATRFSWWAILAASVPFAVALALLVVSRMPKGQPATLLFLPAALIGFVVSSLLLLILVRLLAFSVTGTWRRAVFVPASVHYATAWWPPLGGAVLSLCAGVIISDTRIIAVALILSVVVLLLWFNWLWLSISESQLVRCALPRVLAVVVLFGLVVWPLVGHAGRSVQRFGRPGSSLATTGRAGGVRTFALVIDMIQGSEDPLVVSRMAALGAGEADRLVLQGADCTMDRIRDAFVKVLMTLSEKDRWILYVNGHGYPEGSGAIRMVDGFLTSQMLSNQLTDVPTPNCFVVIDSCFGGKFVNALRGKCDAVVLASTDTDNIAFGRGLAPFWWALVQDASDADGNGEVSVKEAHVAAFPQMLVWGERARLGNLQRAGNDPDRTELMEQRGFMTPQFDVLGDADPSVFAVPVKPNPTTQPASPR